MKNLLTLLIVLCVTVSTSGKEYTLLSPDQKMEVVITVDNGISLTAYYQSEEVFTIDQIALDIRGEDFMTGIKKIQKGKIHSVSQIIYPEIKEKQSEIHDHYQELVLNFRTNYSFNVRVYNDGVAYRFNTSFKEEIIIDKENFNLHFGDKDSVYLQKSETFHSSYETPYEYSAVKDVTTKGICCLPALVRKESGVNVLIMESDLVNYPGLWLKATGTSSLTSVHAGYPHSHIREGSAYGQGQVMEHADHMAQVEGSRSFPWRIFAIAGTDGALITNNLVYQLATPLQLSDISWIKPGVVAFDWWGKNNVYGTDFKSGINTETAKYFIDFCAEYGFEYFLFDDGWTSQDDMLNVHPDLNMEEVMAHAKKREVKIMVWAIWNTFLEKEEEAWEQFEKWGISGIKFDFMNRDDQEMVQFYHHVAKEAAKREMVLDFHGAYKPSGLRRAYPNVLTREALIEFEFNGWTDYDTPEHHNLLPYIRLVTGPADYIPYTTQNVQKEDFSTNGKMPKGMGTRAHSMAMFLISASPMQMLPDSPSDYYREDECTQFISKIPLEWDEVKVLHSKVGAHTVLARRSGEHWYVGAITNWDQKSFEINLDFLGEGAYQMEYIEDGINADRRATDYRKGTRKVTSSETIEINLAPGGGWAGRLMKVD